MIEKLDDVYVGIISKKDIILKINELVDAVNELQISIKPILEQSEICCTEWEKQALDYKAENIALSGDLERTRKALGVSVDMLKIMKDGLPNGNRWKWEIDKALEQITALEQKD